MGETAMVFSPQTWVCACSCGATAEDFFPPDTWLRLNLKQGRKPMQYHFATKQCVIRWLRKEAKDA